MWLIPKQQNRFVTKVLQIAIGKTVLQKNKKYDDDDDDDDDDNE